MSVLWHLRHVSCQRPAVAAAALAALALFGCGGGSDDDAAGPFRVGGTLTGLGAGHVLVLRNNGGDDLRLDANGPFVFGARLASGATYDVTVKTQPDGQTCGVARGSGTVRDDVDTIAVACAGSTGSPVASGTAALEGEWINPKVCSPMGGGQSARQMVTIVRSSDSVVNYHAGTLVYATPDCRGGGNALVSPVGTVTFSRIEGNATVAAHWGSWRQITGAAAAVVWAKPGNDTLCLLGDETPSILPTLDRVAQAAAVLAQHNGCHVRR